MINNRYDFVFVFDVTMGNPNGDPDAGNQPRIDAETGRGMVSDVAIKRKIRNFVAMLHGYKRPYDIYVRERAVLNKLNTEAYAATGHEELLATSDKSKRAGNEESIKDARKWICDNYFDVRTFGAVMSTKVNCGQVRGPVQLTISQSVDPIDYQDMTITRCAVSSEDEADKQAGDNRTMGRKSVVPYGLYVGHGFVSPFFAKDTGFGDSDLEILWQAIKNMFEVDRAASRGEMCLHKLIIFKHDSEIGNAPAFDLFRRVRIKRISDSPARCIDDYEIILNDADLPQGVAIDERSLL